MGSWELLAEDSQVPAVHAALLPNGEVVFYSGNTGFPAETRVWNPNTRVVRTPPNPPTTDLFCSGLALAFDGRLFVAGGTAKYANGPGDPWWGSKAAYLFHPEEGWQRLPDMSFGRWYPSVICLPDGRMLVVSGEGGEEVNGARTQQPEVFDLQTGQWEVLPESANRLLPLFPRLHVLPSGEVACAGAGVPTAILNLDTMQWTEVTPDMSMPTMVAASIGDSRPLVSPANPAPVAMAAGDGMPGMPGMQPASPPPAAPVSVPSGPHKHEHPQGSLGQRQYDLAVLVGPAGDGKVLNAGGGDPPTASVQIIDFSQPAPNWRPTAPLPEVRWFPNSALLPDGTLVVVGGGRGVEVDPILEPAIFNPADETWSADAPMQVGRLYHSTAVLLPDGRVWVGGTDLELRMEVYSPNYLQAGPRPELSSAPSSVTYGQTFPVFRTHDLGVASVSFIRLSAVTHAYNSGQRYIPLNFEVQDEQQINVTAPADPHVAPPGHYMLFVTSQDGVPAIAPIVQLVYT